MKSKKVKKLLVVMTAGVMALGMSTTAFAADNEGSGGGTGSMEGHVDKNVLKVTLPTNATNAFDYTVDPEQLIIETDGAKDSNATFNSSTGVYFQTSAGNYTEKSQALTVTNKGTVNAKVTVEAEVASGSVFTMKGDGNADTLKDGKNLYLGLVAADKTAVALKAADGDPKVSQVVGLKGRPANFETTLDNGEYKYDEKANVPATAWNSFDFYLTGACNTGALSGNAEWAKTDAVPAITVTWKYEKAGDSDAMLTENATTDAAPSIATTEYTLTSSNKGSELEIPVNLGAGDKKATAVTSIKWKEVDNTEMLNVAGMASYDNGKVKISAASVDYFVDTEGALPATLTITFDDSDTTAIDVTLKK